MKNAVRSILLGLGILTAVLVQAQETTFTDLSATNIDWSSAADWQVALQAIEQVPPMPAADATNGVTFWSVEDNPASVEPWPPLPANLTGRPLWDLGDGTYLLDDVDFNYNAVNRHKANSTSLSTVGGTMLMADDDPSLPGDGSTNDYSPSFSEGLAPDYGTNLYIAQVSQSGGNYFGILSNTVSGVEYELQYMYDLQSTNGWQSADWLFPGSQVTNWTAFSVPMISPTNLFIRARSWVSDDGSGLPLWWEEEYLSTNMVDPNAQDSAEDGWTIYQKYTMGLNPNVFYTPPTPAGIAVAFDPSTDLATITWTPSPGTVTNYVIERAVSYGGSTIYTNIPAGTESFTDNLSSVEPEFVLTTRS
jgi:hypothetical protein